jgi:uncharacterized MAPEG superfamily protein
MKIEFGMLVLAIALGLVQLLLAVVFAIKERGMSWAFSPRDEALPPLKGVAGRLDRAYYNFLETFPLFAAAVLLVAVTDRQGDMTAWGAQLYFWSRVVYLPVYMVGVPLLRTLVWSASMAGVVMILVPLA